MSIADPKQFQAFAYRGRAFLCGAQPQDNDTFLPVVICVGDAPGRQTELPRDTEAYSTALTMSSTTFLASPKTIMVLSM